MAWTIDRPGAVGPVVRSARRERGLSQEALALASGTGRRFIHDLEQGKSTVRLSSLLDVLAALDLRVEIRADAPDPERERARP
jgi:HTH-type transcriptional regulator/antitoxin HipB